MLKNEKVQDTPNFSFLTMDGILDGLITKNEMTEERKAEIKAHLAKPF